MAVKARWGGKITDSHSTLTETAAEVADKAVKFDFVSKISLGSIRHAPGGRRNLKFLPITGGLKAVVRGNGGVQDLFIYTSQPGAVESQLSQWFRK
jgi:hypothetical protein